MQPGEKPLHRIKSDKIRFLSFIFFFFPMFQHNLCFIYTTRKLVKSFDMAGIEKALLIPLPSWCLSCTLRRSISPLSNMYTTAFVYAARLIIALCTLSCTCFETTVKRKSLIHTRTNIPLEDFISTLYRLHIN